jgi:hypothetical protein
MARTKRPAIKYDFAPFCPMEPREIEMRRLYLAYPIHRSISKGITLNSDQIERALKYIERERPALPSWWSLRNGEGDGKNGMLDVWLDMWNFTHGVYKSE